MGLTLLSWLRTPIRSSAHLVTSTATLQLERFVHAMANFERREAFDAMSITRAGDEESMSAPRWANALRRDFDVQRNID